MPKTPTQTPQQTLDQMKRKLEGTIQKLEAEIAAFALEHDLPVRLGEYGVDGRELLLWDDSYSGKKRGEWLYSSETC